MAEFRTLDDIHAHGKRVLLRSDLNVPARDGLVSDATRIGRLSYVSAAGGAFLEWLEGRELPNVAALIEAGGAR